MNLTGCLNRPPICHSAPLSPQPDLTWLTEPNSFSPSFKVNLFSAPLNAALTADSPKPDVLLTDRTIISEDYSLFMSSTSRETLVRLKWIKQTMKHIRITFPKNNKESLKTIFFLGAKENSYFGKKDVKTNESLNSTKTFHNFVQEKSTNMN